MSDLGLGKDVANESKLTSALRWHGLILELTDAEREELLRDIRRVTCPINDFYSTALKPARIDAA